MSKHTPGPWISPNTKIGQCVGVYAPSRNGAMICSAGNDDNRRMLELLDPKECEANAILIAAAPDLLDACKKTLELFYTLPNQRYSGLIVTCAEEVEAAVQKAEGTGEANSGEVKKASKGISDSYALDQITVLLSTVEWSADMFTAIADILALTGRTVTDIEQS